jgi:PRTRC genetic system protein E
MFKELAPVLRHRAVLMTITYTENDQIRVNIVPKKLKDDESRALTTPLTVTGTAEELDAELGQTLLEFVGSHLRLKNTLVQAKEDMDAAAKAAQAEARAKAKTPVKKEANGTSAASPSQQLDKPAELVQPPRPKTASLFDTPEDEPLALRQRQSPTDDTEEEDILAEINEDTDEGEQLD